LASEDAFIIDLLDLHFLIFGGRRGRDRMVVGFTTTCVISVMEIIMLSTNKGNNKITEHKGTGLKGNA
jgi:hypothetical protein